MASKKPLESRSLSFKKWIFADVPSLDVRNIMEKHHVCENVARILYQRQATLGSDFEHILKPRLKDLLPNPFILKDMHAGVDTLIKAIYGKETVGIFGDYDVDGATSSCLLRDYLRHIKVPHHVYIPDRLTEGYGPNEGAMTWFKNKGIETILMVDCGTVSFAPLAFAKELGLNIIILDHHLSEKKLPLVSALINPNRFDEQDNNELPSYIKNLCAAGVTFLFLVALQKTLRTNNFFNDGIHEPNLMEFLDLVALGTVCDVMPLTHLNRAFVQQGLQCMKKRQRLGLNALMDVGGCGPTLKAYDLGFIIGPRINAGGRVGESFLGSDLLGQKCQLTAMTQSQRLNDLNHERQNLEKQILSEAIHKVETENLHEKPVMILSHDTWHPGVIGIVASRLKELYEKPVILISYMQDPDVGKGSGRSIHGVSLGDALLLCVKKELLMAGGGHAMAAGLTIARHQEKAFDDFLCSTLKDPVDQYEPTVMISDSLSLTALSPRFLESLHILEPFGQGNPTPKFVIGPVRIRFTDVFGKHQEHIRITFEDVVGNVIKAILFKANHALFKEYLKPSDTLFHCVGTLKKDTWGGMDKVVFYLEDMMLN